MTKPKRYKRYSSEFKREALLGKDAFPGTGVSRDQEVTALKRELTQVRQERDFLRETAAYFAKRSK